MYKGKTLSISRCHQNGHSGDGLEVAELSHGAHLGIEWRQPFSVEVLQCLSVTTAIASMEEQF